MKKFKQSISLIILLSMLLSLFTAFPAWADDDASAPSAASSGETKKKVVAVVYDNSYSMKKNMTGNSQDGVRAAAAKYALQMLISLLGSDDQMFVLPMNDGTKTRDPFASTTADKIPVNLTGNRADAIKQVLENPKLKIPNNNYAMTPTETVGKAISILENEYHLPKNNSGQSSESSDCEYWLVIINDGDFSSFLTDGNKVDNSGKKFSDYDNTNDAVYKNVDKNTPGVINAAMQKEKIRCYIENYTDSLHTVLASFGSASAVASDESLKFTTKTTSNNSTPDVLAKNVQEIANLISGRYTLENSASNTPYTVSGNKVTVDLDKLDFSLSSLSVVAQDCNATNVTVTHNGSKLENVNSTVLKTAFNLETNFKGNNALNDKINLSSGLSCQAFPNDKYLSGGKVVFEFSSTVNTKMVSVLAEPALKMTFDITDKDGKVLNTPSFSDGDVIKIKYKVINPVTNEPVDLGKIFPQSAVVSSVNYNNSIYKIGTDKLSQPITLSEGKGILAVSVSANNGKYVLRDSKSIVVSPKGFKITPGGDSTFDTTKNATATFQVFAEGSQINKNTLESKYTLSITAKTDTDKEIKVSHSVSDNGTITVTVPTADISTDVNKITVLCNVTSSDGAIISAEQSISYKEPAVNIRAEGDNKFTEKDSGAVAGVKFTVEGLDSSVLGKYTASAKLIAKADKSFSKELTLKASGNTFSADLEVPLDTFDVYITEFKLVSPRGTETVKTFDSAYVPPFLELTPSDKLAITQYNLNGNTQAFTFTLTTGKEGSKRGFPIENDFTTFKLTVGGTEMAYTVDGNTLTFIPTAELLGKMVDKPGEYEVKLTITGKQGYDHLSTTGSTSLEIVKTTFQVVAMGDKNSFSSIDRFNLRNTNAVIYFAVFRDGVTITESELKAAYEKGELKIDCDSMLTSFFLPCGLDIKLAKYQNTPVVAVRLTDDMPKYFDWHYSAFITGGDKPITVSYKDAQPATESFTFAQSNVGQHIMRISLLVFVHILIAYIIVYIIGFFKVKRLPSGIFIVIKSAGSSSVTKVNMTFWKKYGWHLTRFLIPWKVLSSQSTKKQCPHCPSLEFVNKNGKIVAVVTKGQSVYNAKVAAGQPATLISLYNSAISKGSYQTNLRNIIKQNAPGTTGGNLFRAQGAPFVKDTRVTMTPGSYYAFYKRNKITQSLDLSYAVRFDKVNTQKKKK